MEFALGQSVTTTYSLRYSTKIRTMKAIIADIHPRRLATLYAFDRDGRGTLFGPQRFSALRVCDFPGQELYEAYRAFDMERIANAQSLVFPGEDMPPPPDIHPDTQPDIQPNIQEKKDVAIGADEVACNICFSELECTSDSVSCPCGLRMCADCTNNWMPTLFETKPSTKRPLCPLYCGNMLSWSTLATCLTSDDFDKVNNVFTGFAVMKEGEEAEAQLAQNAASKMSLDMCIARATELIRHRRDEIDTLMTPCCSTALLDFDGCFAIHCSCNAFFCAWCMDIYQDSHICHEHVKECTKNPDKGNLYGTMRLWHDVMNRNKLKRKLEEKAEISLQFNAVANELSPPARVPSSPQL